MKREQMAKTQYKAVAFAAVLALLLLPIAGCATGLRPTDGLFSWHSAAISSEEARQALFSAAAACGAGTIYQGADESGEAFSAFCDQAKAKGLSTYLLVGQPKWALDASGERQQAAVSWAAELGADGIVFDIEPYLLAEWDTGREELAQSWVSGLIAAKTAAKQRGVSMIVCVPYYLEDKIDGALYERLVRYGCDGLAVMNYYKKRGRASGIRSRAVPPLRQGADPDLRAAAAGQARSAADQHLLRGRGGASGKEPGGDPVGLRAAGAFVCMARI